MHPPGNSMSEVATDVGNPERHGWAEAMAKAQAAVAHKPRQAGSRRWAKTARPRRQGQDGRAKTAGPRRQGRATGRRRRRWVKRQRLCGYEYAQCVCRWPSEIGTDRHGISICSSRQTDLGTPPIAPCTRPNSTQCPRAPATTASPCAAGGHRRERLTRLRCQHHLV